MACKGLGLRRLVVLSEVPVKTRYWIRYVKLAMGTPFQIGSKVVDDLMLGLDESLVKSKTSHCSFCGHPNSKRAHFKATCEYCGTRIFRVCLRKPEGSKCNCSSCNEDRKEKEQQKHENWRIKVCSKISMEPNFSNDDII